MDEILFAIVQCVLVIVAGLITRYVVPWLKTKLDAEKLSTLEQWVKLAVAAAEQVFCKDCQGSEKKTYVRDELKKYLNSKGLKISDEQLDILIEAAVKEMNLATKNKKNQQAASLVVTKRSPQAAALVMSNKAAATQKQATTNKDTKTEDTTKASSDEEDTDI